ncbi:MAG: acetyl-CoA carboxylase biotin carboxyl carrier protein subunit, partial [Candidatus Korarchaeota archaeon]|nr:acetyl-CoA carboxylase biotin carboxyl carrier protein subunit [Candidatus Korarchaeota archaeon]
SSTAQMDLVVDNTPFSIKMHTDLDEIVYKNSGGAGAEGGASSLLSQIPGKVISLAVEEGSEVKKGDPVCTLESMK